MNQFKLQLGDPFNDGHGMYKDIIFNCNKPLKDVEDAFYEAKTKSKVNLNMICQEYEDRTLEPNTWKKLKDLGFGSSWSKEELSRFEDKSKDWSYLYMDVDIMTELFMWYIKLGDPTIEMSIAPDDQIPAFGMILGYGLFSR